ncbi:hypothetical protein B5F53_06895 [Blautia sp. An249]|uniref:histidine phosphatase family protein n=1 Tax=Blautia sp. An249 TaxID=1965603 RepID=UPI000B3892FE|nr:histidine phosphatase family protein [Blautia sp. An249]OUO79674.1 hypothetical protein B5F53_06895 [Blautia sp. An249]
MNSTKIYIIRHGETRLNAEGRLQGHTDIPLNENGKKLAEITGEGLRSIPFDCIISSPLSRAVETAQIVTAPSSRLSQRTIPIVKDPRLMEISWGRWDELICTRDNFEVPCKDFTKFYTDPLHFPAAPEGESVADVCKRVANFWDEFTLSPSYQNKTILISAHGCSVRALLYYIDGSVNDFWRGGVPQNCSVSLVEITDSKPVIRFTDQIYYDPSLCANLYK